MDNFLKTEKVFTILEINTAVRDLMRTVFPHYIWVCGEIQGLRAETEKKHTYFELIQKHPTEDTIIAKVKAALFANKKPLIMKHIQQAQGAFELKNDIEVKFLCEVSLHPPTGQYSLIIVDVDPAYTLGKFAQNRLRIIEELKKEGLIERNKLLQIPDVPLHIGLITAYDSAAYHDFINELSISGFGFIIFSCNAYMQGQNVESDVIAGLRRLRSLKPKLDVIAVTRGGGSRADLSWFDNKKIAEEIAFCNIPVLSALGHHIDISVVDFVAHSSFKTPTKVAQFLVERVSEALNNLEDIFQEIIEKSALRFSQETRDLKTKTLTIDSFVARYFIDSLQSLAEMKSTTYRVWEYIIQNQTRFTQESTMQLKSSFKRILHDVLNYIKYTESKIELLNPQTILKRGYSITLKENKAVKSIAQLRREDLIRTIYSTGESVSKIETLGDKNAEKIF